jgi:hypothetical protein
VSLYRYTVACLQQRRTADLAAAWQRQQAAFLADSGKMLHEAATAAAAGAEAAAARLAWEAAGGVLAGQLAELQQAKQQEQQVRAVLGCHSIVLAGASGCSASSISSTGVLHVVVGDGLQQLAWWVVYAKPLGGSSAAGVEGSRRCACWPAGGAVTGKAAGAAGESGAWLSLDRASGC